MYTFNSYYLSQYKKFIFQFFLLLFLFTSLSVITFNCFLFLSSTFVKIVFYFYFFFCHFRAKYHFIFFMLIQIYSCFTNKNNKKPKKGKVKHIFFKAYPANQIQVKGLHYHFVQYQLVLYVYVCFQAIFVLDNFYYNLLQYYQLLLLMLTMVQAFLFSYIVSEDANDLIDYNLDFLSSLN